MGMIDEIKSMGKAILGGDSSTDTPVTDSTVTDLPGTDAPVTELPDGFETDAPTTELSSTETPGTDTPTTELPDESTRLKAELESLRNEVEELKNPKPTEPPPTAAPIDEQDFLDGIDIDTITDDKDVFNKLLNSVYKKGIEFARVELSNSSESIAKTIPDVVTSNISTVQTLEKVTNEFYANNEDLKPYMDNVSTIFGEVAKDNLDKSYPEILKLTADETRKRLNITKSNIKRDKKPPKLPSNKGNKRQTKTEPKGIDAEIESMNKALRI